MSFGMPDNTEDEFPGVPTVPDFPNPPELRAYSPQYDERYGHYILPDVNGKPCTTTYPRATTIAKALDDQTNLERWKIRRIIRALTQYPQLLKSLNDIDFSVLESDKHALDSRLDRVMSRALDAVDEGAAPFGTAVHNWCWAVEIGFCTLDGVPEMLREHVAAYLRALARENIVTAPDMFERIVYNPETDSAGTLDRIYQLPDGTWVIGDLKTSSNISWSWLSIGAQLAQYSNALLMLSLDGTHWEPMPEVSKEIGIVAHVPHHSPDRDSRGVFCDLVEVNLVNGTHVMSTSAQVRAMRREAKTAIPSAVSRDTGSEQARPASVQRHVQAPQAVPVMAKPLTELISEAIAAAQTPDQMNAVYDKYKSWWTDEHTAQGNERLENLGYTGGQET